LKKLAVSNSLLHKQIFNLFDIITFWYRQAITGNLTAADAFYYFLHRPVVADLVCTGLHFFILSCETPVMDKEAAAFDHFIVCQGFPYVNQCRTLVDIDRNYL
jgi:hypothetical protein